MLLLAFLGQGTWYLKKKKNFTERMIPVAFVTKGSNYFIIHHKVFTVLISHKMDHVSIQKKCICVYDFLWLCVQRQGYTSLYTYAWRE